MEHQNVEKILFIEENICNHSSVNKEIQYKYFSKQLCDILCKTNE